jgi:peptidoglycan/xylan/chitin deacetylase (PgdA/CDA1 family)
MSKVADGDIILMHDIYPSTLEAIKLALPLLAEQGYEFVTVSELLGDEMQPGKKYNKAY